MNYCPVCGTRLVQQPQMMQQPSVKLKKDKGKKLLIPFVIGGVTLLVMVAVLVYVFVFKLEVSKSEQEKALDRYFEACENLDIKELFRASYPMEYADLEYYSAYNTIGDRWVVQWITKFVGLSRGARDLAAFENNNSVTFEDYPYTVSDEDENLISYDGNRVSLRKCLPNLSVSYEIVQMAQFNDCEVSINNHPDLKRITSMDNLITVNDAKLDVDDMYVAQIRLQWKYGDYLYGWDPAWWKDKNFQEQAESFSIYNYEDAIDITYDHSLYNVFIYKYDGVWYVYPVRLDYSLAKNGGYYVEYK